MKHTIVVTRPKGDEESLSNELHRRGYRVIHEPLSTVYLDHTERLSLAHALGREPDAIILTSRHGAEALSLLTDFRDMPLVCVGLATAEAAYSKGFSRVSVGGGTAQKLVELIVDAYDAGSRFLYLSGRHIRTDIDKALAEKGMQVERLAVYEAVAATQLSDILAEHLRRGHIDGVTFLSQRAAATFAALLPADAVGNIPQMHTFCLSAAVTEPLLSRPWKSIQIAYEPTLASLVECVDNVLPT